MPIDFSETIHTIIADQFFMSKKEITNRTRFSDLSSDSFDIVEFAITLEEKFSLEIINTDFLDKIYKNGQGTIEDIIILVINNALYPEPMKAIEDIKGQRSNRTSIKPFLVLPHMRQDL